MKEIFSRLKKIQEFEFIGYTLHNVRCRNEIAFHGNIYVCTQKVLPYTYTKKKKKSWNKFQRELQNSQFSYVLVDE